jgi:enoyl-CoA hydratase
MTDPVLVRKRQGSISIPRLGCDVVVASQGASFGLPEVKRGLFAAGGGVFLGTRIPLAVALELALTGDLVDASRPG